MKDKPSKLDPFAERLDDLLTPKERGGMGQTLQEAQAQLLADGCSISLGRLSEWWSARQNRRLQEQLLGRIASGARQCKEVETQFGENPAPALDTLIKLHRVLVLQLSTQASVDPKLIAKADMMLRTVMEFQAGQTKAELEKQKLGIAERRVTVLEGNTARAKAELQKLRDPNQQLSPEERKAIVDTVDGILGIK